MLQKQRISGRELLFDCRINKNMYRKKKTSIISTTSDIIANEINDDKLLHDLNPEQKRAVTCSTNQSTLVLSGAGLFYLNDLFFDFLINH